MTDVSYPLSYLEKGEREIVRERERKRERKSDRREAKILASDQGATQSVGVSGRWFNGD